MGEVQEYIEGNTKIEYLVCIMYKDCLILFIYLFLP